MKPYGREKNLKGNGPWKTDYHPRPKRKWKNWWEDIVQPLSRSAMKRRWKKEVQKELD